VTKHFPTYDIVANHLPLIRKLTKKFNKKTQERGKFSQRELVPVAVRAACEALPTFRPELGFQFATHIWKRIECALFDYVGDRDRIVHPVEMEPEHWRRCYAENGGAEPLLAEVKLPPPCDIPSDNPLVEAWRRVHGVTVCPPPKRERRFATYNGETVEVSSWLLKPSGHTPKLRHDKISAPPMRLDYDDNHGASTGQVAPKFDSDYDESNKGDLKPSQVKPIKGKSEDGDYSTSDDHAAYTGGKHKQRWSVKYLNAAKVIKSAPWFTRRPVRNFPPSRLPWMYRVRCGSSRRGGHTTARLRSATGT
jgi:hypothetical protein